MFKFVILVFFINKLILPKNVRKNVLKKRTTVQLLRSYRSNFLSRKSLTASQNESKEKWKGKYSKQGQISPPLPL